MRRVLFSDYYILTYADIQDCGDHLKLPFRKSKNNQFYQGSMAIIAAQDKNTSPVKLIRLYFVRFGLVLLPNFLLAPILISGCRGAVARGKPFRSLD